MLVVCKYCGVSVAQNRVEVWVHLDGLPDGFDEHYAEPADQRAFIDDADQGAEIRVKVEELIRHHGMYHPLSDCQFTDRVRALMRVL